MKKVIKILVLSAFLFATPLIMLAQNPPHPNGGSGPGSGNTPVGGGAPIDGGLSFLLILGAAYGSKKIFKQQQK
ncbi:MAG: hypothetical protein B6D61_12280 [Bacteroidetes bacterium 4484_249]|nr:MAG: hypothetical protein B6D61_12280 [Bacteroidetes bacterium 4484_249]